jgi:uncharacterized protein YlxW (UPF0749 family)
MTDQQRPGPGPDGEGDMPMAGRPPAAGDTPEGRTPEGTAGGTPGAGASGTGEPGPGTGVGGSGTPGDEPTAFIDGDLIVTADGPTINLRPTEQPPPEEYRAEQPPPEEYLAEEQWAEEQRTGEHPSGPTLDEPTRGSAPPGDGPTAVLDQSTVDRARSAGPPTPPHETGGTEEAGETTAAVERTGTATGGDPDPASPDAVTSGPDDGTAAAVPGKQDAPWRRLSSAGALIWVLLALFGFTLVVQLRSNDTDDGLAGARQDDLVRILSDLEARDTRLQAEIAALESSRQQLTSGVAGREAALAEADKRADELGLLAGTLPGRGPGLVIRISGVKASEILNAVQELRGAGGEVMQVTGSDGGSVRIVASTYFVEADGGGMVVDGTRLSGPYTVTVIGAPQTMQTALEIPGGVVASVQSDGGSVTMEQRTSVEVTAVRKATSLQYARPVS